MRAVITIVAPNCTFNAREFQNLDTLSTTGGDDGSVASPQLLRENVVESAYGCDQMLLVPVDESIAAYLQNDLNDEFFLEFEPGMMRTLAHGMPSRSIEDDVFPGSFRRRS